MDCATGFKSLRVSNVESDKAQKGSDWQDRSWDQTKYWERSRAKLEFER